MNEQQPQVRIRINVGTSVKGIHTYDATVELTVPVEMIGAPNAKVPAAQHLNELSERVLAESARVVGLLDAQYSRQWENGTKES